MIGIKFRGRLGNQLFQFYFYRYLKHAHPDRFIFFVNPQDTYLPRYFEMGKYNLFLGSKLCSLFTRYLPKIFKFKVINLENFQSPKRIEIVDKTLVNGFFQSDWYLNQTRHKYPVQIKSKYRTVFRELYGQTFEKEKTIVVHIRRTDYLNYNRRDISLPVKYFKRELAAIKNVDEYKVFFVSDDIPFVKEHFPEKSNYIFSTHDEIIDFQIIMNADIAIISNSSFAWWAAYLSEKENLVIAPKNWLGFRIGKEHPKGIMTDRFIWKEVQTNSSQIKQG